MDALFLKLLNMSMAAGWLILAVAVLRLLLKKAPKAITCLLWALVALRLLLPLSIDSSLSVFNLSPRAAASGTMEYFHYNGKTEKPLLQFDVVRPAAPADAASGDAGVSTPLLQRHTADIYLPLARDIWLAGVCAMLLYAAVSYLLLRRRVRASLPAGDNIWLSDDIRTPFIWGLLRPRVYLPSGLEEGVAAQVIAHEKAHLQRRDHIWKPLGFLLLSVYWFHPLVWLAYILLCRDIELACDERVVCGLSKDDMIAYSEALLACSAPRRVATACPLAFGEVGVKERVKTVLNYKKPAFWVVIAAVIACAAVAVCFLTDPKGEPDTLWAKRPTIVMDGVSYIDPYMPVSEPPYGYTLAGTLSEAQANDTGLAGCEYYAHPHDEDSFFVFQECGTPIDENTVDSEKLQWAYVRWIREGLESSYARLLTLDDIRFLVRKGDALTWADFDKYAYIETGSGLYIRVYEIDDLFSLMLGGGSADEPPLYIRLVSAADTDDYVDIRDGDVEGFIRAHQGDTL